MDKNLQAFLVIADTENITAAAERLNITQPTLTKRLQQLEAVYDCKLVERLTRGVKLTQFGIQLLSHARRIEHAYLQAQEGLTALRTGHLEELRIGAGPLFHLRYLAPTFKQLRKEFPNTLISLTADVNSITLPKLWTGNVDIVFGFSEHLEGGDHITFHQLTTVEVGLALSACHHLAQKPVINVHELGDMEWTIYTNSPDHKDLVRAYYLSEGLAAPKFAIQSDSVALSLQMVADGGYVMPLPLQLNKFVDPSRVHIVRTSPPISQRSSGAYVRHSSLQYPIVKRLIEMVREAVNR
jgi:DNA-binding transcriptional LysR family regulator